jgi:hypothetical protein
MKRFGEGGNESGDRRRPDPRTLAAAALLTTLALGLGAWAAGHGPAAARHLAAFLKTQVLDSALLSAPAINAERADHRTRG